MSAKLYRSGAIVMAPTGRVVNKVDNVSRSQPAFGISFAAKQKIISAACVQGTDYANTANPGLHRDYNQCFLTLTFDRDDPDSYIDQNANEAASRFFENIRKRYGCTSYVWTREVTKELTPHFHALVSIPFTPVAKLNRAWSHARGDISTVKNALRTGWDKKRKRPVMKIRSLQHAAGYAAKYIAKANAGDISVLKNSCKMANRQTWEYKTGHKYRAFAMSQNLKTEPLDVDVHLMRRLYPYVEMTELVQSKRTDCEFFFLKNLNQTDFFYSEAEKVNAELAQMLKKREKSQKSLKKSQKHLQKQLFHQ